MSPGTVARFLPHAKHPSVPCDTEHGQHSSVQSTGGTRPVWVVTTELSCPRLPAGCALPGDSHPMLHVGASPDDPPWSRTHKLGVTSVCSPLSPSTLPGQGPNDG